MVNIQSRAGALHTSEYAHQRQVNVIVDLAGTLLFKLLSQRVYQGANCSSLQRHLLLRILFIGKYCARIAFHKGI